MVLKIIIVLLPWSLKKRALTRWFKYNLHPESYIGLAWIFPQKLIMEKGAKIDHLTVAVNLDCIVMKENSSIGRSNWITGFPSGTDSPHFIHQKHRTSKLVMNIESAITKNHHLDCTSSIDIGVYTTIAGYQSQLLTHSINLADNRQDSAPIYIGDYAFIGTNCVILGGASLPSRSVLGAKSLLNKKFSEEWTLYAGVPAKPVSEIPKNAKYFSREGGFVN